MRYATETLFVPLRMRAALAAPAFVLLAAPGLAAQTFSEQGLSVLGGVDYDARSASLGDMDNDGDLDLFFQGGGGAQQLFRNNLISPGGGPGSGGVPGALTYTNVTATLPAGLGTSWSAAWGDYDGDGNVDIFVGQSNLGGGSGDVLRNDGAGNFTNTSFAVGLNDPGFHQNVAWVDIDGDLDLDMVMGMEGPEKHEIYLQGNDGQFTPVGALVGIQEEVGTKGYGMAIGDTDGDGDLDIYISTCRFDNNIRNNFYENQLAQTGTLSFIDIADDNGTQLMTNSYGSEFHDFDDDGDLDLFVVGADRQPSKLWRNDGNNFFTDTDFIRGAPLLTDGGGDLNGAKAVDYDNDGDLDLFFHDHLAIAGHDTARKLYRNDGDWNFTDVTAAEGLDAPTEGGYDSAWADLDNDGDQDLIATTESGTDERVFISNADTNGNHWLYVGLAGTTDNTTAIGATLYATINQGEADEKTLRREANTNAGTFNQSDLPVHFGLGQAAVIDLLRIVWPDGTQQALRDVAADQYLAVSIASLLEGDYNASGQVEQGDLDLVLANWGVDTSGAGAVSDGWVNDLPVGLIEQGELDKVLSHWGAASAPDFRGSNVPEPAGLALLAGAALTAGRSPRRRSA